jgi:hypothetical protein
MEITKDLKTVIDLLKPWHIKSVNMPSPASGDADSTEYGNSIIVLPKYKIDPSALEVTITFNEDEDGNIMKFLTLLKHHNMDPTRGHYRTYAESHPIDITVMGRSGRTGNGAYNRDRTEFLFCSLDTINSESYDYESDDRITITAKFRATSINKWAGQGQPVKPVTNDLENPIATENDEATARAFYHIQGPGAGRSGVITGYADQTLVDGYRR